VRVTVNTVRRSTVIDDEGWIEKARTGDVLRQMGLGQDYPTMESIKYLYSQASEGNEYTIVEITVENTSRMNTYQFSFLNIEAVDPIGTEAYQWDPVASIHLKDALEVSADVLPLHSVTGTVPFEAPIGTSLMFHFNFADLTSAEKDEAVFDLQDEVR
jgi:hypothetical protein